MVSERLFMCPAWAGMIPRSRSAVPLREYVPRMGGDDPAESGNGINIS